MDFEDVSYIDSLIEEYLVFRGFTKTKKVLKQEQQDDKLQGYESNRIVHQLFDYIRKYNFDGFISLWDYLSVTFFSRLENDLLFTISRLELSLKRYYLINAVQNGRKDKCFDFFEKYGVQLSLDERWRPWFVLPYVSHPEVDQNFRVYFTKKWVETLFHSLQNFLSTIFNNLQLPKILNFNVERKVREELMTEIERQRREIYDLKGEISILQQQLAMRVKKRIFEDSDSTAEVIPKGPYVISVENFNFDSNITCAKCSNNGDYLAVASENGSVTVIRTNEDDLSVLNSFSVSNETITALEWEPNRGIHVLLGTNSGKIKIWNILTEKSIAEISTQSFEVIQDIHSNPVQNNLLAGSYITESGKCSLILWDLSKTQKISRIRLDNRIVHSFDFNHNGTMVIAGCSDGSIRLFDMNSGECIDSWKGHNGCVHSVRYNYDETCVISVGASEVISWSPHFPGRKIRTYDYAGAPDVPLKYPRIPISFDKNCQYMLLPSQQSTAKLYNLTEPAPVLDIGNHSENVTVTEWHPSINQCISASHQTLSISSLGNM